MTDTPATIIHQFLQGKAEAQQAFLAELVRIPSDNPPGDCAAHAVQTASLLTELGLTVERHAVPAADCQAHGMQSITNLIVRRRFGDGPVVALNAHGDVVPPGDGWTTDPYGAEIRDGMMYGRGVAVSKSDFATYAFALLALEQVAPTLKGTVELHLTYDEEAGGLLGPAWLLAEDLTRPDMAIAAGFSYSVVTAHNGCLHLAVEITGKSAHAADPKTGHDALAAANQVLSALYAVRETYAAKQSAIDGIGSPSLVVGLIEGGINTNVVPDKVTFRMDRRLIPEEDAAAAEADLRNLIAETIAPLDGIACAVERILLAEPLRPIDGTDQLADVFCRHASAVMATPVTTTGVPLYADARLYASAGVPTIMYGTGPRDILDANAHRADERIRLSDLAKATEVVALAVAEILS
jgi:acetylornithine deacetylase/succinyl-diaminopimelate desuccinylase-like protein